MTNLNLSRNRRSDRSLRINAMSRFRLESLESRVVLSRTASMTMLTASMATASYGQAETFTAQVQVQQGTVAATPTGAVQFYVNYSPVGSPVPTSSANTASFTVPALPVGSNTVTAFFLEDGTGFDSSGSIVIPITADSTAVNGGVSAAMATAGQSETLTASVVNTSTSQVIPSGTVQFLANGKAIGSAVTLNAGQASMTTTALPTGASQITAVYTPDSANFSASNNSSSPVSVTVAAPVTAPPQFPALVTVAKADLTVFGPIGTSGKYGFQTLTAASNFNPSQAVVFDNYGYGFGNKTSIPVSADYFGDGKSAYGLWTPNGLGGMTFTAVSSMVGGKSVNINFGQTTDVPVIADVDGDGKPDFGVFGYQAGLGYRFDFLLSSANFSAAKQDVFNNNGYEYGNASSIPVVADFDGSGKAGFGLFNPSKTGSTFTYVSPSAHASFSRTIGNATDIPMAVSYDGDNKADLALYGPDTTTGKYRYEVLASSSGFNTSQAVIFNNYGYGYGNQFSIPVVADYEGNGKADFAVYTTNFAGGMAFSYQTSQTGAGVTVAFGTAGDIPLTTPAYLRAKLVRGLA